MGGLVVSVGGCGASGLGWGFVQHLAHPMRDMLAVVFECCVMGGVSGVIGRFKVWEVIKCKVEWGGSRVGGGILVGVLLPCLWIQMLEYVGFNRGCGLVVVVVDWLLWDCRLGAVICGIVVGVVG